MITELDKAWLAGIIDGHNLKPYAGTGDMLQFGIRVSDIRVARRISDMTFVTFTPISVKSSLLHTSWSGLRLAVILDNLLLYLCRRTALEHFIKYDFSTQRPRGSWKATAQKMFELGWNYDKFTLPFSFDTPERAS